MGWVCLAGQDSPLLAANIGSVLWVYSKRGWGSLNEITRILLIDYLAVLVLAGLIGLGLWLARLIWNWRTPDSELAKA